MEKNIYETPQLQVFLLETGTAVLNNVSNEKRKEENYDPDI